MHAQVEMMLHRPFMHYLTPVDILSQTADGISNMDSTLYSRAVKCLDMSHAIIEVAEDSYARKRFNSTYWVSYISPLVLHSKPTKLSVCSVLFSTVVTIFCAMHNPRHAKIAALIKDSFIGHDIMIALSQNNLVALRWKQPLEVMSFFGIK